MTKQKDWYVELGGLIIAGSFTTRREARREVWRHALEAGDTDPWGSMGLVDREYPSFYAIVTDLDVYHIGLGSAICDQGQDLTLALVAWQRGDQGTTHA